MLDRTKIFGGVFQALTALACLIIITMVAIVIGNIAGSAETGR